MSKYETPYSTGINLHIFCPDTAMKFNQHPRLHAANSSQELHGKLVNDSNLHSGENETGLVSNVAFPQELHGKLSATGSSSRAVGPASSRQLPMNLQIV